MLARIKAHLKRLPASNPRDPELPDVGEPYASLPLGGHGLKQLIEHYSFTTVLDVGCGPGMHSDILTRHGKTVTAIDFRRSTYYEEHPDRAAFVEGDYIAHPFSEPFDALWVCHVLEHQPNPHRFIKKLLGDVKEGGVLALTVPPAKHEIVGGHLTLWNAGLLLYHLVFAGCDCRHAAVLAYGYNISVIVVKKTIHSLPTLDYDTGDIDRLAPFFPPGISEPFDGRIRRLNWLGEQP